MATDFSNLRKVMLDAGLLTQKELIARIEKNFPTIPTSTTTVSRLFNGKLKHIPVDLIYAISSVTNSKPGDWISIDENPPQFPHSN